MAAGVFTKGFTDITKWAHAVKATGIVKSKSSVRGGEKVCRSDVTSVPALPCVTVMHEHSSPSHVPAAICSKRRSLTATRPCTGGVAPVSVRERQDRHRADSASPGAMPGPTPNPMQPQLALTTAQLDAMSMPQIIEAYVDRRLASLCRAFHLTDLTTTAELNSEWKLKIDGH